MNIPDMIAKYVLNFRIIAAAFVPFVLLFSACAAVEKPQKEKEQSFAQRYAAGRGDFNLELPIIQHPDQGGATITWHTSKPAVSWVEIAPDDGSHFYSKERPKYYEAPLGRKKISKIHNVKIDGLDKDTKYRYRIFSREVLGTSGTAISYGETISTPVYKVEPLSFKTPNPDKEEITFCVLNDIHQDSEKLRKLLSHIDMQKCDFIFLNGDMVNYSPKAEGFYKGFLAALAESAKGTVPVYFLRGNHETRGANAQNILELFPTPSGYPYYLFKCGPVAFVAIDTGEDKPDSDIEYYDNNDFDAYRTKQAQWLKKMLGSKACAAPVKIAFAHMPLGIEAPDKQWHGCRDAISKFVPILNEAGVDVVFSGHIHKHANYPPMTGGKLKAQNIVNSNDEILRVTANKRAVKVEALDADGNVTHSYILDIRGARKPH